MTACNRSSFKAQCLSKEAKFRATQDVVPRVFPGMDVSDRFFSNE